MLINLLDEIAATEAARVKPRDPNWKDELTREAMNIVDWDITFMPRDDEVCVYSETRGYSHEAPERTIAYYIRTTEDRLAIRRYMDVDTKASYGERR